MIRSAEKSPFSDEDSLVKKNTKTKQYDDEQENNDEQKNQATDNPGSHRRDMQTRRHVFSYDKPATVLRDIEKDKKRRDHIKYEFIKNPTRHASIKRRTLIAQRGECSTSQRAQTGTKLTSKLYRYLKGKSML